MSRETCPLCHGEGKLQQTDTDWDDCPRCSGQGTIEQQTKYPMCKDQPAQIDCRNTACKYHINATCTNISPAITLTPRKVKTEDTNYVMHVHCWSFEPKPK